LRVETSYFDAVSRRDKAFDFHYFLLLIICTTDTPSPLFLTCAIVGSGISTLLLLPESGHVSVKYRLFYSAVAVLLYTVPGPGDV
jgi:hypothetical protein